MWPAQALGVRLGVALRWSEAGAGPGAAGADGGGSADLLAAAGAREVAGPMELQAMLCSAAVPGEAGAGGPGGTGGSEAGGLGAAEVGGPGAAGSGEPGPEPASPHGRREGKGAAARDAPPLADPASSRAEPLAPGAEAPVLAADRREHRGAEAAAALDASGSDGSAARQGSWALFAAVSPARLHLSGAEAAALAAVAGGAGAEAERRLRGPFPARAMPMSCPSEGLGQGARAGSGHGARAPWLAEVAVETGVLRLTYAPGGSAAALASTPPPAAFLSLPAAAANAFLGRRGGCALLVSCNTLAVAAAANPGTPENLALGGGTAVVASLAAASLWAGPQLGAAAAAADFSCGALPATSPGNPAPDSADPNDWHAHPDSTARPDAAQAAPTLAGSGEASCAQLQPPAQGEQRQDAAGPGSSSIPTLLRVRTGSREGSPRPHVGPMVPAPPRLLAGGAAALLQGPCQPALLASPVCLLVEAAEPGESGGGGGGQPAAGGAACVAVSVESVSGALSARHLQALVRAPAAPGGALLHPWTG